MTRPAWPRLRLSLWLLVFYVTLTGFWLIIFNWHQTKELESLERAWQTAGWRQATLLAHMVTPAFQGGDRALLRQTVVNFSAADQQTSLLVLDATGAVLARAPESAPTPTDLADHLRQRVLASGQPEMQTGQTLHDEYYAVPVPAPSGGVGAVVVTENNWEAAYAAAQRGSWLELEQTLLVIVLGICLLAVWTSAALRPIARLHELTRAAAAGRWERQADWHSSVLEFDDLLVAFNHMLSQLTQERADLEAVQADTRRQAAAFAALHHVGLELGRQLDLPSLLRAIVAQAVHLFEAPMGGLYLLLPDEQTLELAVSFTHPTDFTGMRLRLGEGLAGHVAQTGEPMVVDDYGAWPGRAHAFGVAPFRSVMQAPIKWRNRVVGVISVDDARPHRFDAEALNLLALFADQAAVAIANARLFQNLAEEKNRIELLYTLSQRLNAQLDLQEASDRSLELTMRALNVDNGNLWILDDAGERLSLLSAYRRGQPLAPLPTWNFKLGEGLAGQALLQREPLVSANVRADARWVVIPGEDEAVRSAVSVPMWAGETPVGVINLRSEREGYFARLDAPLLVAAATSVGFALQNARLFSETRRRERLEHEQRTLAEAMRDTVAALNSTLNLDEVLDRVLLNLDRVVPYEGADVLLVENGLGRVVRWHRRPEYERADWLRRLQVVVAEFPTLRQMFDTGQPLRFEDTHTDPRWVRLAEDMWVRSYLGAPISSRGEVVGFLNLSSTQPGFFTETHEHNLQTFAHQVAVAIDNARLYQLAQASARTAEEAAAESARLYRASAQLLALSGDLHDMARHIVRIVMDEFSAAHCGVLVLDEAATELRLTAQGGQYEMPLTPLPLNGRGLVAAAARTGEVIYAPEVSQDERYYPGAPSTRSELALPLHVADWSRANGERVIGVLNLESSERDAFDEQARRILAAFAEQSGLALENAQLLTRLHLARFMAEEANQLKSQFLANTSHELRTPLTGIIGALSLILEGLCDTPAEEREFLQVAYGASRNLLAIVNDVLDIAKIEAGKMEVEAQPVLLSAVFEEIGALLRVQADEKRLRLDLAPPSTDTPVYADPAKVRQILINLMSNALKFTERGSIRLRAYADPLRRQMVVEVQDTGIGIPPEKQGKLFQPFVQADGSMTRHYGGTGLGLSISRSLAELMGGTLTLFSAGEGQGSTFTLRLPFAA